jgi:hypothetical protein
MKCLLRWLGRTLQGIANIVAKIPAFHQMKNIRPELQPSR